MKPILIFAINPQDMRLGLCADVFSPFGISRHAYSCWPMIITPYNLPSWMRMKREVVMT